MKIIEILDEDDLLRRVPCNNPNFIKPDGTICSYAYKPRIKGQNEISVNVKKLTTYRDSILDDKRFSLIKIETRIVRENGFDCYHSPEEMNYSHASVTGEFTNSRCKKLSRNSIFISETEFG